MKRILKMAGIVSVAAAVLSVIGSIQEISGERLWRLWIWGIVAAAAACLKEKDKTSDQELQQELFEQTGTKPLGFIRKPPYIRSMYIGILILMAVTAGLLIVTGYLCYMDGALEGEALFYMIVCWISVAFIVALVSIQFYKSEQEIAYSESYVVLRIGKKTRMITWPEFGIYKKLGKQVTFYSRNGEKLFAEDETCEGYAGFWKLYQKHVKGMDF